MNGKAVQRVKGRHSIDAVSVAVVVVGALALLVAANLVTSYILYLRPLNASHQGMRSKWDMLLRLDHPIDWLILGDSAAAHCAMPAVFSDVLGGTAVNLAVPGAIGVRNSAWILRTYVDRWGAPGKGVILMTSIDVWVENGERTTIGKIPLPFRKIQRLKPKPLRTGKDWVHAITTRYFPLYSDNRSISEVLRTPWRVEKQPAILADGSAPMKKRREPDEFKGAAFSSYLDTMEGRQISTYCRESLDELAAIARSSRTRIYLVLAPVDTLTAADPRFQAYQEMLVGFLKGYADSHPELVWIPDERIYAPNQFHSVDHLMYPHTIDMNRDIAEKIRDRTPVDER